MSHVRMSRVTLHTSQEGSEAWRGKKAVRARLELILIAKPAQGTSPAFITEYRTTFQHAGRIALFLRTKRPPMLDPLLIRRGRAARDKCACFSALSFAGCATIRRPLLPGSY
jgi:hypothetical protein